MHVVSCAPDYLPHRGGAEIGLHTMLRRARELSDHRFSVVVPTVDQSLPRHERIDGIDVHRFRRPGRWMRWYAPTLACAVALPVIVPRLGPDVLHLSYALPSGLGGALAARIGRVPYLMSLGGNDVSDPINPPSRPLRLAASAVARHAEHVLCNSSPTQRVIVKEWHVNSERASVNPFGVDIQRYRPARAAKSRLRLRLGVDDESAVIVAVQRLERRKGVDVLIDALAMVGSPRLEVLIVGDGRERADLEHKAAQLDLPVRFLGSVSEDRKIEVLQAADLFVLASRHEGQGIVLAEAASCGLPLIATDRGGTVDMVKDKETGLLVPAEDPEALARAIDALLTDRERLASWGDAARRWAARTVSIDSCASRFLEQVEAVGAAHRI